MTQKPPKEKRLAASRTIGVMAVTSSSHNCAETHRSWSRSQLPGAERNGRCDPPPVLLLASPTDQGFESGFACESGRCTAQASPEASTSETPITGKSCRMPSAPNECAMPDATQRGRRRWPLPTGRTKRTYPRDTPGLPIGPLLSEKFADRYLKGDGKPVKCINRSISGLALHVGDERTVDPASLGEFIL